MRRRVILLASVFIFLAAASVYGQTGITAKIDFPFTVEGKVLPAGEYQFVPEGTGGVAAFSVQSGDKNLALATVLTRLSGEMQANPEVAHLVFDVIGDKHVLSEIWTPGEDGYLVAATKELHKHKVVKVKR